MKDRFYLRSAHGNTGSNMVWHCHEKRGYHTDLALAHVMTRIEAQEEWNWGICQPVSADHVDALATWKVDHQYIPHDSMFLDDVDSYVLFQKSKVDGNDVYWMNSERFNSYTDFSKASTFTRIEAQNRVMNGHKLIAIPYAVADGVKRRTFEAHLFNPRTMVQGAGLRMSESVKKERRRVKCPKTRLNCPACGKINWQYHSHDFEVCSSCHHQGG